MPMTSEQSLRSGRHLESLRKASLMLAAMHHCGQEVSTTATECSQLVTDLSAILQRIQDILAEGPPHPLTKGASSSSHENTHVCGTVSHTGLIHTSESLLNCLSVTRQTFCQRIDRQSATVSATATLIRRLVAADQLLTSSYGPLLDLVASYGVVDESALEEQIRKLPLISSFRKVLEENHQSSVMSLSNVPKELNQLVKTAQVELSSSKSAAVEALHHLCQRKAALRKALDSCASEIQTRLDQLLAD